MRLVITGATGFVGRNLLLAALASGRYSEIIALVRSPEKIARQLADEEIDPGCVRVLPWGSSLPTDRIDHAIHCAGVLFARDQAGYFGTNVEGTLRFVEALPPETRLLVLSSQSAGGPTPQGKPAREIADPDAPITWYGKSKLEMERRLRALRPGTLILRPPMILGPRDRASLPLFRLASGALRLKPGLADKSYSWIAVGDLVQMMLAALVSPDWSAIPDRTRYAAAPEPVTDRQLISAAAAVVGRTGITLPLPHLLVRTAAAVVDAVPALRDAIPSLGRDRVREIFAARWIVDGSACHRDFSSSAFASLPDTLAATCAWYIKTRQLAPIA